MNTLPTAATARRAAVALLALAATAAAGCSQKLAEQLIPNQPPEVRLTGAPAVRDSLNPDFYAYRMQWMGYDPDGRVEYFLWALDPANPGVVSFSDTTWRRTTKNESTFFFTAATPSVPINPRNPTAISPHVFAVYAVDNQGALSLRPAARGFFSFTQAPYVQVTDPAGGSFTPTVTPTTTVRWVGTDDDGQFRTKPLRYAFRLFGQRNADFPGIPNFISFALNNPDSMRRMYAPDFPGWTHVGGETTSFQFRNLIPQSTYLFVVTGFDEAGAYDPVFFRGKNMVEFAVTFAGTFGPVITMFNQFFNYTYPTGGYRPEESRWFRLEIPADFPVTFNWRATAPPGADIRRFRWAMDLVDLSDETPRSNEATDWYHWSAWSLNTTSATIGPFVENGESHLFYIEAEDNNGLKSLGIIFFTVVRATLERELLLVDDTRMRPDTRTVRTGPMDAPTGPWPTAAELDTFLFARGGVPYREYPSGTMSTPGIFNGYAYDTVGTRGISVDGLVPLSLLGRYRHVIWYTDENAAVMVGLPTDANAPGSSLRIMTSPGRPTILATYIVQGGRVWLAGGGAAMATLHVWNRFGTPANEYTAEPDNELVPGRFMYDFAHWRVGIRMGPAQSARKLGTTLVPVNNAKSPGRGWPGEPDYSVLPATLLRKSEAPADPPPPQRAGDSSWYRLTYSSEYIFKPTWIREDYDPDPDRVREISTLDTLYLTSGGTAIPNSPVMTFYHGLDNQPLVFSGFNFWFWKRDHCIALVDFVLQKIWGLQRNPGAPRGATGPVSARRAAS